MSSSERSASSSVLCARASVSYLVVSRTKAECPVAVSGAAKVSSGLTRAG